MRDNASCYNAESRALIVERDSQMSNTDQAIQAQTLYQDALLRKANVVGVAVGYKEAKGAVSGDVALVVLVEQKKPLAALSAEDVVPPEVDGMKTDVYEVGYLRALHNINPRQGFRPIIPNGVSIGHFMVTAGTLGTIVHDRVTGDRLLLSNNHVFANSNDAEIGDPILQPAAMDGGNVDEHTVARLERYVRLRYIGDPVGDNEPPVMPPLPPDGEPSDPRQPGPSPSPVPRDGCDVVSVVAGFANVIAALLGSDKRVTVQSRSAMAASASSVAQPTPVPLTRAAASTVVPENTVDCALARPLDPEMFSDELLGIGVVNETTVPMLGMRVRKYGRTTRYTEGNITLLNATVNVAYSTLAGTRTARFVGQVITEAMSQGGDSGALVVDAEENKAVGLLFAGSNPATIFTPIDLVLNALNIRL